MFVLFLCQGIVSFLIPARSGWKIFSSQGTKIWALSGDDSNWMSLKVGPVFGQCSTIPPLSSHRSGGWMPSVQGLYLLLVGYPGLKQPTGLALFHLITLTCLPAKVTFRVGISPRFSSMKVVD